MCWEKEENGVTEEAKHITSCFVISWQVRLYHAMLHRIISWHGIYPHITSCHATSLHVMACHIMSFHVMACCITPQVIWLIEATPTISSDCLVFSHEQTCAEANCGTPRLQQRDVWCKLNYIFVLRWDKPRTDSHAQCVYDECIFILSLYMFECLLWLSTLQIEPNTCPHCAHTTLID